MRIDVDKWVVGQNGSYYFDKWSDANKRIMERIGKPSWVEEYYSNGFTDIWMIEFKPTYRPLRYKVNGHYEYSMLCKIALTTDGKLKVILPKEIEETINNIYKAFEEEGMTK